MPELRPFQALRYTPGAGDPSALIAPPYDVIDDEMAEALRLRSPHNCVRLILPAGGSDERYTVAAGLLQDWIASGVLAEDGDASVFVYLQTFASGGQTRERGAFFAAVRLAEFGDGEILPHEETHSGPKRDRLALTLATKTQLSPAFLIAGEDDDQLSELLRSVRSTNPVLVAETGDGVRHTLWRAAREIGERICATAGRASLLIADGHHRYETALEVSRQLSDNVKARYILACVVGERDPGLVLATTHRTLAPRPEAASDWLEDLALRFEISELPDADPARGAAHVEGMSSDGAAILAVHAPGEGRTRALTPRPAALAEAGVDALSSRVASVVFDRLVLRPMYGLGPDEAAREHLLSYWRQADDATSAARSLGGAAFLLPPARLSDVRALAARGERLPPKSTYFEPKVPSGLMFRRLTD